MKRVFLLAVSLLLTGLVVSNVNALDQTGKWAISLNGGAWKPVLTDHSDIWTVGPIGTFAVRYGFKPNISVGVMGSYGMVYQAKLTGTDGAGFTIDNVNGGIREQNILIEAAVFYHFLPEGKLNPYLFGGGGISIWSIKDGDGNTLMSDTFGVVDKSGPPGQPFDLKDKEITALVGGGVEWFAMENLSINLGARFHYLTHLLTDFKDDKDVVGTDPGELDLPKGIPEAFAGVTYYFGAPKDSDKDGVPDDVDQCPDTPVGALVDANGCPTDADGDGVYDGLDKCPDTPRGAKVDAAGCPMDSDKDGVFDGVDKCPDTPSGVQVDASGCPMDSDADGVPDYKDKQMNTMKGCKVDADGVSMDSDGDGVCDGLDRCEGTPAGTEVDASGCPKAPAFEKTMITPKYAPGSSELDAAARAELDKVAMALSANPMLKIEIGAYTDASGTAAANMRISQKRADTAKAYLVTKGIEAARITAKGYGATNFIADNETREGRAKNRRLEITPMM